MAETKQGDETYTNWFNVIFMIGIFFIRSVLGVGWGKWIHSQSRIRYEWILTHFRHSKFFFEFEFYFYFLVLLLLCRQESAKWSKTKIFHNMPAIRVQFYLMKRYFAQVIKGFAQVSGKKVTPTNKKSSVFFLWCSEWIYWCHLTVKDFSTLFDELLFGCSTPYLVYIASFVFW